MLQSLLQILFPSTPSKEPSTLDDTVQALQSIPCALHKDVGIDGLPHTICSAAPYAQTPLLQRAMFMIKYRRIQRMIPPVATLLLDVIRPEVHQGSVLCPVPLHWSRYIDRGFNQSVLIADFLHEHTGLPVQHLLRRIRDTGHQAWRSREKRLVSMENAFTFRCIKKIPERVVLIDDIATTGATLHACAKALQQAGVKHIDAWVVARG